MTQKIALPVALAALLSACVTTSQAPKTPDALKPPADQRLTLEAMAEGMQIYECSQKTDGSFEWAFKAPEAKLTSHSGKLLGKHYGGPTWESVDGSSVAAAVTARDPGPDPSAIPWLLLTAKSNNGAGVFAKTKSIQRVNTVAGLAPKEACNAAKLKQVARVPYTATYYFYE